MNVGLITGCIKWAQATNRLLLALIVTVRCWELQSHVTQLYHMALLYCQFLFLSYSTLLLTLSVALIVLYVPWNPSIYALCIMYFYRKCVQVLKFVLIVIYTNRYMLSRSDFILLTVGFSVNLSMNVRFNVHGSWKEEIAWEHHMLFVFFFFFKYISIPLDNNDKFEFTHTHSKQNPADACVLCACLVSKLTAYHCFG